MPRVATRPIRCRVEIEPAASLSNRFRASCAVLRSGDGGRTIGQINHSGPISLGDGLVSIPRWSWILIALFVASPAAGSGGDSQPILDRERRQEIGRGVRELTERLERLRDAKSQTPKTKTTPDQLVDAEVYLKGITWALNDEARIEPGDVPLLSRAIETCRARVASLETGKTPWTDTPGRFVRGFVSALDGSVQPYGVIVPKTYDRTKPIRLDVVLHGSSRPLGVSELRFMSRFDDATGRATDRTDRDYLEVHPLGRVENGYRWAGETDVFEAIEAACRNYAVDRDRIVLRGMSMGASGTWHLGLKYPDRFVALGPYCGYVDTHAFSRTPLSNFVEVGPLPDYQEKLLHMLDSVDYAANAGVVPAIACMGEKDVFFQAHVIMGRAMAKEGLTMVNLISPGTGHVLDPTTHAEQMRGIGTIASRGMDRSPAHIRFVTWTLKYNRCHWLQVLGMDEHYTRAELDAKVTNDGTVEVVEPKNITRFAILPPVAREKALRVQVGGFAIEVPSRAGDGRGRKIVIGKRDGRWAYLGDLDVPRLEGKRPGLQGPIDDAFTAPFLCVRGTGAPWNPAVQAWSDASLKQFAYEWNHYFRGELPVKDDTAVTEEDVRDRNLILFGDPGSNFWIRRILPRLPIRWTRTECAIGATKVSAVDHAPVLIQPNPLSASRYVVVNSGHTFHEKELSTLNYLLFPRLGDWAIVKVGDKVPAEGAGPKEATVVRTGFFDEHWAIAEPAVSRQVLDKGLAPFFSPPAEFANDMGGYRSPLRFQDGSPVRTAEDWNRRRREIQRSWHELMGPWPPLIEKPRIEYLEQERRDPVTQHHIRLEIAPGRTTEDAYLLLPDGAGPFPAALVVFYESKTGIGRGTAEYRDFAIQLARRGFVILSLGGEPAMSYPSNENPQLQPLSFHAYVAANAYNALASLPQIDPGRIGVLGHSYGGKWAMFASCLFDKFACGVWSDPGVVFDESRPNVNYWEPWYLGWEPGRTRKRGVPTAENPRTGVYKRLMESGKDLHELHALMAPRPFLVSGGSEDPPERWKALNHAIAVSRLLGHENRVGMTNRPGHSPTAESNEQIYRFLEHELKSANAGTVDDRAGRR